MKFYPLLFYIIILILIFIDIYKIYCALLNTVINNRSTNDKDLTSK